MGGRTGVGSGGQLRQISGRGSLAHGLKAWSSVSKEQVDEFAKRIGLTWLAEFLQAIDDAWIEEFRINPAAVGPFSNAQIVALICIAAGASSWLWFATRSAPVSSPAAK